MALQATRKPIVLVRKRHSRCRAHIATHAAIDHARHTRQSPRMAQALSLFDLPHHEARRVLARGATVFLPVNPVEYHGPHLSLHNDSLISAGLIHDIWERVEAPKDQPLVVAADLEIGVDPCPGPGTRTTPFAVAVKLVREACRALVELGAQRVVLMTFHGSPLHSVALDAGVAECASLGARAVAPLHAAQRAMLDVDTSELAEAVAHVADRAVAEELLNGLLLDFHAGFLETSLSLHYAPHSVSAIHRELPPCPKLEATRAETAVGALIGRFASDGLARELDFAAKGRAWYELRPFPGYTSRPSCADAGAGRYLAAKLVDFMVDVVTSTLDRGEAAPRPFMGWIETVTLGGRVPTHSVKASDVLTPESVSS